MTVPVLRRLAPVALVALVALFGAGCSGTTLDSAATVSLPKTKLPTVTISNADFQRQLRAIATNPGYEALAAAWGIEPGAAGGATTPTALSAFWLSQELRWGIYGAVYQSLGLQPTDPERENAAQLWEQTFGDAGADFQSFPKGFRDHLIDEGLRYLAVKQYFSSITPDKVKDFYDRYEGQICPSGRAVSHVLVTDEREAQEVLTKLGEGTSLADLAEQYSIDTGSKAKGGDLGCAVEGLFVPEFEAAVTSARFGVPVGPVKTEYGYHVIVVQRRTFEDVADELTDALESVADPRAGESLAVTLAIRDADVRVNPRYGTVSLEQDPQGGGDRLNVTPPNAPEPSDQRGGAKLEPASDSSFILPRGGAGGVQSTAPGG